MVNHLAKMLLYKELTLYKQRIHAGNHQQVARDIMRLALLLSRALVSLCTAKEKSTSCSPPAATATASSPAAASSPPAAAGATTEGTAAAAPTTATPAAPAATSCNSNPEGQRLLCRIQLRHLR